MGQTLTNGVFLPDEGERNCYTGLAANWRAFDAHLGDANIHVTYADKEAWNNHVADTVKHVTAADKEAWNGKADASALTAHTGNTTIHVTAADKEAWNGKADASALTAHTGNTTIHVTAADKNKWDAVTTKANDADAVHKSGAETIPGAKTFSTFITSNGSSTRDEYSNNASTNLWLMAKRDTDELSGVLIDTYRQNSAQGTGIHILGISIKENSIRYEGCRWGWYWDNNLNGYTFDFKPTTQGANQALKHNLGTSTDKWDTINGINPGALSLPDLTAGVDISAYITNLTGASNINKFTPTADGWISIGLSNADFIEIYIPSSLIGGSFTKSTVNNFGQAFMPVIANKEVRLALKGSSIGWAKFYPCQGNV